MKAIRFLFLFTFFLIGLISFAQKRDEIFVPKWKLNSIGVSTLIGIKKYFTPRTLETLKKNSKVQRSELYFFVPTGSGLYNEIGEATMANIDPAGFGVQINWQKRDKKDEIRLGFSFQDHFQYFGFKKVYFKTPDTVAGHELFFRDKNTMLRINILYLKYTKPFWEFLRLYAALGLEGNVSTRYGYERNEEYWEVDTSKTTFDGNYPFSIWGNYYKTEERSLIDSKPSILIGSNAIIGVNILMKKIHTKLERFGINAEYGMGIGIEQVFKGSTSVIRAGFGQLSLHYFLN